MINPHLYEPMYKRVESQRFAGAKHYQPIVAIFTRRTFRRASEAKEYAERVHARWCRLYEAAIVVDDGQETIVEREPAK